jgi:Domain of unknown function (DUF4062)
VASAQIFLSTVSAEFRSYRDTLRHDLDRPNVTVKIQEDFIATGTETLDKLDAYIRQCDAVIHLVGDMTGALAQPPSVAMLRERYADLAERLPVLGPFLQPDAPALSERSAHEERADIDHKRDRYSDSGNDTAASRLWDRHHFKRAKRESCRAHPSFANHLV